MNRQNSTAVAQARDHIAAWSHHDWDKTRQLLAPDVHVLVTSTQLEFGTGEYTGVDAYMEPKVRAAQLIEPGSVRELSAIGDEHNALVLVTFRIRLGQGGAMVTMARSCLYWIDENAKIKEERDVFYVLPQETE
jgi:SnoaL-like domain